LAAGTSFVIGSIGAAAGGGLAAWAASGLAFSAALAGRSPSWAFSLLATSSVAFLVSAVPAGSVLLTVTGTVALGGVTTEMLLGHWYLVDPRLPRWALKRLVVIGAVALIIDALVLGIAGGTGASTLTAVFVVLSAVSVLLMTAVWFALREPAYSAVMAATGLSYLALLTSLGATMIGRSLISLGDTVLEVPRLIGL
jgi:hypothetical protein